MSLALKQAMINLGNTKENPSVGCVIIKNNSFKDHRGYYWTSWKKGIIKKIYFKHDKFSLSKKNVLRGLHGDKKTWKLITCLRGEILCVVVDYRPNSKNYLKHNIEYF